VNCLSLTACLALQKCCSRALLACAGSAAAVGSGLLPFALGNDAAGSVRVPAALCGCVGFMASRSRITPQGPSLSLTIGQNGFFTTSARDSMLLYAALADKGAAPLRLPRLAAAPAAGAANARLRGLRVGLYAPWFDNCERGVRERCYAAVAAMEGAGAPQSCYAC
jgi:aspartyl-tRNA(Asn)/glutamyl-tRNA(Gln) amidotransferase subunit A